MNKILVAVACAMASVCAMADDSAFGAPIEVSKPQPVPAPQQYSVFRADGNMRVALARWAKAASWSFEPEYWAVDRDVPVIGDAALGTDFKAAVRTLMRSTELTEMPLKPCFYTNQVVRIVPRNEKCDKTRE